MVHFDSKIAVDSHQLGIWIVDGYDLVRPERFDQDDIVVKILNLEINGPVAFVSNDTGSYKEMYKNA